MKRTLTVAGAVLAVLTAAPLAMAQAKTDFGQQGQFILSADRLVPFFGFTSFSINDPTGAGVSKHTTTITQSSLSFFYGSTPNLTSVFNNSLADVGTNVFYTVPRLGFDYVIAPNITVGGDIVLYFTLGGHTSDETDRTDGTSTKTSNGNPSVTVFGLAPRGGYILPLTDMFSLWLRGGFSYYTASSKLTVTNGGNAVTTSDDAHQASIDLDPQLVFTPIPHVGFTGGLTVDIPFGGGVSESTQTGGATQSFSTSSSIFYFGLTLGMLVRF